MRPVLPELVAQVEPWKPGQTRRQSCLVLPVLVLQAWVSTPASWEWLLKVKQLLVGNNCQLFPRSRERVLGWESSLSTIPGLSQSHCHWEESKSTGLSSLGLSDLPTRTHIELEVCTWLQAIRRWYHPTSFQCSLLSVPSLLSPASRSESGALAVQSWTDCRNSCFLLAYFV